MSAVLNDKKNQTARWKYLVPFPHKEELYFKGRKLPACSVWRSRRTEGYSLEEAAFNWDLSVEAVLEAVSYCEQNQALFERLAEEDIQFAKANDVGFGLKTAC
jgi:hypothetical protein